MKPQYNIFAELNAWNELYRALYAAPYAEPDEDYNDDDMDFECNTLNANCMRNDEPDMSGIDYKDDLVQ